MSRKLSNEKWNEFINLFSSYEGTVSSFCEENSISKTQFYYHIKKYSRQTMSKLRLVAANLLEDIYIAMKDELLSRNYIQADETTLKVIDDNGKESKSKKYMLLYKSGELKDPIILYDYQKTRSSS